MGSGIRVDKAYVVDVEATCWEPQSSKPDDQEQEIIEIGIVELLFKGTEVQIGSASGLFVKPTGSKITAFCQKLTGIDESMVEKSPSFAETCEILRTEFGTHKVPWLAWGDFDRLAFERQCEREDVRYPMGRTFFNLKALHAIAECKSRQVGVPAALATYGLEFEGRLHRALDDTINIAKLAATILSKMRRAVRT